MPTTTDTFTATACIDCVMFLANGETPLTDPATGEDMTEDMTDAWVQNFVTRNEGIHWAPEGDPDDDHFSWSSCELCGSTLGGTRIPVAGWGI